MRYYIMGTIILGHYYTRVEFRDSWAPIRTALESRVRSGDLEWTFFITSAVCIEPCGRDNNINLFNSVFNAVVIIMFLRLISDQENPPKQLFEIRFNVSLLDIAA